MLHNADAETGRAKHGHIVGVGEGTTEAGYTRHGATWHLSP
jgi:hypothetical protein